MRCLDHYVVYNISITGIIVLSNEMISDIIVMPVFLHPVTHVTHPKYNFQNKIMKNNSVHSVYSNDKTNHTRY